MTDERRRMTDERRGGPELSAGERDFVDHLNASFAPPPLTAARRAAFDERVRLRLATPRWNGAWAPALVAASVAALALIWVGTPGGENIQTSAPTVALVEADGPDAWTQRLLFGDPSNDTLEESESGMFLPPEYAAIDSWFFEG